MANFLLEGRAKALPDVMRTWMFEVWIPDISLVTGGIMGTMEDLIIRARTATIPGRSIEPMTSEFMGMKQYFPGKTSFENTFSVSIEETSDQMVWRALSYWQNQMYLVDPLGATGGVSQVSKKRDICKDVYVKLYKHDGTDMTHGVRFWNAWPSAIAAQSLDYASNEQAKFEVTFTYDFWTKSENK